MVITLKSNIPYLQNLTGTYTLDKEITTKAWLICLGVKWDYDALVILNDKYCNGNEVLQDRDIVQLLIPISGG